VYGQLEEDDDEEDVKEQVLPQLGVGDVLKSPAIQITSGETKPPKRFTEATLLSAMENPAPYMSGERHDLIRTIHRSGGLGTVATRADIIEKLFSNFYIEKRGQEIHITSKGLQLLELVPEKLKSPVMTAEWEMKLESIAQGKLDKQAFIREMQAYAKAAVQEIKDSTKTFKHDNITATRCPNCGKAMLEVKGKRGRMLVCSDRECGHRKTVAISTNARCPNCMKRLELRGEGEGRIFVCACGYREKLSAYEKRKAQQSPSVSKREVANYLRKQKQLNDEPLNTALADALAKLKLQQDE
jgi:DNA topoisomerase-3